jgi:hypothetical protein
MRRPFAVRCSSAAPEGLLEVRIELAAALTPELAERAQRTGRRFFELANAGALCGDAIAPDASGIGGSKLSAAGLHVDWLFNDVNVDPLAATVALNMIEAFHEKWCAVRSVYLGWKLLNDVDNPSQLLFPKIATPLPFAFSYDQDAPAFDIIVDFASPQNEAQLELVNETLGQWLRGVALGAYGDENSRPAINRIDFVSEAPCTLESDFLMWSIESFNSTPHALAGMVNVVSRIHRTLAPVRSLEISE